MFRGQLASEIMMLRIGDHSTILRSHVQIEKDCSQLHVALEQFPEDGPADATRE